MKKNGKKNGKRKEGGSQSTMQAPAKKSEDIGLRSVELAVKNTQERNEKAQSPAQTKAREDDEEEKTRRTVKPKGGRRSSRT